MGRGQGGGLAVSFLWGAFSFVTGVRGVGRRLHWVVYGVLVVLLGLCILTGALIVH